MIKFFIASLLSLSFTSCASKPSAIAPSATISESEYYSTVEKFSGKVQQYEGLQNTLQFHATLLNDSVRVAQLSQNARTFQWDELTYQTEKEKISNLTKSETQVFLSIYTPEKKHDDLHKSKTLWKIFLDVGGKRYEGRAVKSKLLTTEIANLYQYHNRWSTPYLLVFPVATTEVEKLESRLTLTGPVGSGAINFSAISGNQ